MEGVGRLPWVVGSAAAFGAGCALQLANLLAILQRFLRQVNAGQPPICLRGGNGDGSRKGPSQVRPRSFLPNSRISLALASLPRRRNLLSFRRRRNLSYLRGHIWKANPYQDLQANFGAYKFVSHFLI